MSQELHHRQLVFAKRLFMHGRDHGRGVDVIDRMISIHNLDNAIELVLKTIAAKNNIISSSRQEFKFKDLWNKIQIDTNIQLPLRDQIFGLHNHRNLAQHQGDAPDPETVLKYTGYAEDFLKQVIHQVFDLNYDELTLIDFVKDPEIRATLESALRLLDSEKFQESIQESYNALIVFRKKIFDYFVPDITPFSVIRTGRGTFTFALLNMLNKLLFCDHLEAMKEFTKIKLIEESNRIRQTLPSSALPDPSKTKAKEVLDRITDIIIDLQSKFPYIYGE